MRCARSAPSAIFEAGVSCARMRVLAMVLLPCQKCMAAMR